MNITIYTCKRYVAFTGEVKAHIHTVALIAGGLGVDARVTFLVGHTQLGILIKGKPRFTYTSVIVSQILANLVIFPACIGRIIAGVN